VKKHYLSALFPFLGLFMCSGPPKLATVSYVEIERFMGNWYVIANIPTFLEKGAHNAIEAYKLDKDGSIATTFTFYQGSFDGQLKTYRPRGFVRDNKSNAIWDMQFLWPFRSEYLIINLDKDYAWTVIGRSKLDYVWIMARKPEMPDHVYQVILKQLSEAGYDIGKIQKVPQKWASDRIIE
jgi:apolipoprotein D and lipocalin family protein